MKLDDVKRQLAEGRLLDKDDPDYYDDEPIFIDPDDLRGLKAADIPKGVRIQVGRLKDGVQQIELEGCLSRGQGTPLQVEMSPSWYRKYWSMPLGMTQYFDLVRRAIETRQRTHGDVVLGSFDNDDEPWIHLNYTIHIPSDDVEVAYAEAQRVDAAFSETADAVCAQIDLEIAKAAQLLSGWGRLNIEQLLDQVEKQATPDAKGRVLEELTCQLLQTIPGFEVSGRVRTATEEIDISVINGSDDPIWKREGALILAECKNWSSKCGKDEFVLFQEKLRNRHSRCSCGLLVSWNGFAGTVTKEMLRGSTGELLIVAINGRDLRDAVREGRFLPSLSQLWKNATML